MYHVFIYSSVDGLLGYFHILAIVYSTAVNSGMHVPIWTLFFSGVSWFNRLIKWVAIDSWLDLQPLSPPWRSDNLAKSYNPCNHRVGSSSIQFPSSKSHLVSTWSTLQESNKLSCLESKTKTKY